ncbi:MAG: phosphocholine cytidylyltransferase family protein [Polyangiaceae bacterium]|nr:phosphocholine cytidylyltransferase family protein [Polyangiaceae bacterium]
MRAIVIGAGRGARLGCQTDDRPKGLVEVMGRPMLEWILEALGEAGIRRSEVVFVSGWAEEAVRARYPEFTYVRNERWAHNNVLASLLCAREHLLEGCVTTYADIVYDGAIVRRLVAAPEPIVLGCDTRWRRRYAVRTQHPESDAEKLRAEGRRVVEVSRRIPSEAADGEFIGVTKLSAEGARRLVAGYDEARARFAEAPQFREGRTFERAYLIDLLAFLLERGEELHREDTAGAYMEIDTEQDLAHAAGWWETRGA